MGDLECGGFASMTLYSTLQLSKNALEAAQIGVQVTGNNIANANTPGYIRERLNLVPTPTQSYGGLLLGTGVRVDSITQQTDRLLEARLRSAGSDVANSEIQENTYNQLETILGTAGDGDLSAGLTSFFNRIQDVLNQPDSASVRNLVVLEGRKLTDQIKRIDSQARDLYADINSQLSTVADEVNSKLAQVANLNLRIQQAEGGNVSKSDAVGLRDQRTTVLNDLAKIIDIRTQEQPAGDVSVYSNGDYLIFEGTYRPVESTNVVRDGLTTSLLRIKETEAPVASSSGKLAGLLSSRDEIVSGFLTKLNDLAKTLAGEFNKVYSTGQGQVGFSSVSSLKAIGNPNTPLDQAKLPFTPVNGSFEIQVKNSQSNQVTTKTITVDLNGLDEDTSLTSLASQIDAIDGISAKVDSDGKLNISADSSNMTFSFANDTSGTLAALGINTFFTGSTAQDIGINAKLQTSPQYFAASLGGAGNDAKNAERLASFLQTPLSGQSGLSIANVYDKLVSDVSDGSSRTKAAADGFRTFEKTLSGQYLAVTGVSIDEETVRLLTYQRMFQASARVITTINEMLDTLIKL